MLRFLDEQKGSYGNKRIFGYFQLRTKSIQAGKWKMPNWLGWIPLGRHSYWDMRIRSEFTRIIDDTPNHLHGNNYRLSNRTIIELKSYFIEAHIIYHDVL